MTHARLFRGRLLLLCFVAAVFSIGEAKAQTTQPVLLSEPDSTRAISLESVSRVPDYDSPRVRAGSTRAARRDGGEPRASRRHAWRTSSRNIASLDAVAPRVVGSRSLDLRVRMNWTGCGAATGPSRS